jgi:hypothetical protein
MSRDRFDIFWLPISIRGMYQTEAAEPFATSQPKNDQAHVSTFKRQDEK